MIVRNHDTSYNMLSTAPASLFLMKILHFTWNLRTVESRIKRLCPKSCQGRICVGFDKFAKANDGDLN